MRRGTLGTAGVALVLGLLIAGCASLDTSASSPASPVRGLAGSWHGVFWWLGGSY